MNATFEQNRSTDLHWCVVYTRPNSERKTLDKITKMGVEAYLPLHKVVRQWNDRVKKMEVPLFPNYVFVRVDEAIRVALFSIKEIVNYVSIEKRPVVVREKEISLIKKVLSVEVDVTVEDYFLDGMEVMIESGRFAGLHGRVIRRNGGSRLLIRVDGIMKSFSFNIPASDVRAIHSGSELVIDQP
jgi:transcription antitermination factor NusG